MMPNQQKETRAASTASRFSGSSISGPSSIYEGTRSPIKEELSSYTSSAMQRSESFENPSAGRGAMSFGSYSQDDEKSSGTPKFGKALYDFTAGGDDEVMYDKYSGRSHRFAFVTMNSVDDATAAIGKLNDTEIGGRKIKVNITEKPLQSLDLPIPPSEDSEFVDSPYKVSVGNLAKTVTSEILTWFFSEKGKVLGAKVFRVPGTSKTSGFGFIAFSSDEEVEAATAEFNNAKLNNMLLCQAKSWKSNRASTCTKYCFCCSSLFTSFCFRRFDAFSGRCGKGSNLCPCNHAVPVSTFFETQVAVLLHGLEGSGKRTIVRYVARHLGLHVVEYSCHDLMPSSEKKASIALAHAFKAAYR